MSATMTQTVFATMPSPVGELLLAANRHGLTHLLFLPLAHAERVTQSWVAASETSQRSDSQLSPSALQADGASQAHAHLQRSREQLEQYFAGTRQAFTVPLASTGTAFQRQVWQALEQIPYGQTWSYRDVALHIGNPKAVRAVGLANGCNPISIVVPCHRVIGANGALTGYGGGLERKKLLLSLESGVALSSVVSD